MKNQKCLTNNTNIFHTFCILHAHAHFVTVSLAENSAEAVYNSGSYIIEKEKKNLLLE